MKYRISHRRRAFLGDDKLDLTEARGRGGLGLISLDERVRLVGGQVTIRTGPQGGTEVRILVPIPESPDAPPDGPAR